MVIKAEPEQPKRVLDPAIVGKALQEAVHRAVAIHRALGKPMVVAGPDGKPQWIDPATVKLPGDPE